MKKLIFTLLIALGIVAVITNMANDVPAHAKAESIVIKSVTGNVLSADTNNEVRLTGRHKGDSPYYQDVKIEVIGADGAVINTIIPKVNSGYGPDIMLADFGVAEGREQIFYGVNSGGSGGFGFFYLYSVDGSQTTTVFDYEDFGAKNTFTGQYIDGFKAQVNKSGSDDRYIIDLSLRPQEYKDMIWDSEGRLLAPKSIDISGVNTVFPYYNYLEQNYQLLIYQRITGLYGADGLGYITTQQRYGDNGMETFFQALEVFPN